MVNGKDATLKEDGTYTIESVSKDLTIEAVFAKDKTPEPEKPDKPKPEQPETPNKPGKPNKPCLLYTSILNLLSVDSEYTL